jgi:hypothetical protein
MERMRAKPETGKRDDGLLISLHGENRRHDSNVS